MTAIIVEADEKRTRPVDNTAGTFEPGARTSVFNRSSLASGIGTGARFCTTAVSSVDGNGPRGVT